MSPVRTRSPAQRSSRCSSGVERFLGKEEVPSSNLGIGSTALELIQIILIKKLEINQIKV
jgi:hypothetical protein